MRLAFLMLVHDSPRLAIRIAKRLLNQANKEENQKGREKNQNYTNNNNNNNNNNNSNSNNNSCVIIHCDAKMQKEDFKLIYENLKSNKNIFFTKNRRKVYWGSYSIVEATLDCISELYRREISYDYAMLISGHHYPLKTFSGMIKGLQTKIGKKESIFLRFDPKEIYQHRTAFWYIHWKNFRIRLPFFQIGLHDTVGYFTPTKVRSIFVRKKDRDNFFILLLFAKMYVINKIDLFLNYIFPSEKIRKKPRLESGLPLQIMKGSQWWCLSKDAIDYVRRCTLENPYIVRFFKYSDIPDESFFHSILKSSHFNDKIIDDNLLYYQFKINSPHPIVVETIDLKPAMNSDKFFCRKVYEQKSKEFMDSVDKILNSISRNK